MRPPPHIRDVDGPDASERAAAGGRPVPVGQLVAAVTGGASVLVTGSAGGAPLLAALAQLLARTGARIRVLHVRPPLDLQGFMKQVARVDGALDGSMLEQGFDALTIPGADCDRIALLVEDADKMPRETLRYLELALGMEPCLQVILAGQSGISDMLALDGFAGLRRRIALHVALPDAEPSLAVEPSRPQLAGEALPASLAPAEALPRPYRTRSLRHLTGAALAAGLALVAGSSLLRPVPSGGATRVTLAPPPSSGITGPAGVQEGASTAVPASLRRPEPAADGPSAGADHPSAPLASVQPVPAAEPSLTSTPAAPTLAAEAPATPDRLPSLPPEPDPVILAGPPPDPVMAPAAEAAPSAPAATEPALASSPAPTPSAPVATADATLAEPDPMPLAEPRFPAQLPAAPGPAAVPATPVPHRAQSRPASVRPERVADRRPAPAQDAQRCRSIILRLQLGEAPNDGERIYLRNGCR